MNSKKKNPYKMPDEMPIQEKKYFPGRIDAGASQEIKNITDEIRTDISGGNVGIDKGGNTGVF